MLRKILIVYGTTDGQTRKIADALAAAARVEGASVQVLDARHRHGADPCPADYDGVMVAASVHAGGYQRAVRKWVSTHAAELRRVPNAFVSVCLGVLEHNPNTDRELDAIMAKFFAATQWTPAVRKLVAGALPYTRYNVLKRWMLRRIVAKAGGDTDTSRDYEYTDWHDVEQFAREFVRAQDGSSAAKPFEAA